MTDSGWMERAHEAAGATDPAVLERLTEDPDPRVRTAVADRTPDLPRVLVARLAADDSVPVRLTVARETADAEILTALAADEHARVRQAVAEQPATPIPVVEALAGDPAADVRTAVASRDDLPERVLVGLTGDRDAAVGRAAALTLGIPSGVDTVRAQQAGWTVPLLQAARAAGLAASEIGAIDPRHRATLNVLAGIAALRGS